MPIKLFKPLTWAIFVFIFGYPNHYNIAYGQRAKKKGEEKKEEKKSDMYAEFTLSKLSKHNIPKELNYEADTMSCGDCWWWYEIDELYGPYTDLYFIQISNTEKLFFICNNKEYKIPLISRVFKEARTIADSPADTGTMIFEGSGFKVINQWAKAGFSFGSFGTVTMYYNGDKILEKHIRTFGPP